MDKKLRYSPMSANTAASAILLLVISLVFVLPVSIPWGIAFSSVGLILLIAAFASVDEGPIELIKEYEERERRLWSEFEKKAEELRKSKERIGQLEEEKERLEDKIMHELKAVKPESKKVVARKKVTKKVTKKVNKVSSKKHKSKKVSTNKKTTKKVTKRKKVSKKSKRRK
jgi:hypothetical protein